MRKAKDIFSILIIVLVTAVILRLCMGYKQTSRFEAQKLDVTLEQFKSDWGKPKKEFVYKGYGNETILMYDCYDFWGHNYVFKFDEKNQRLTYKYYDD